MNFFPPVRTTLNNLPAFITNDVKVYNFCKIHHATFDYISKGGPEPFRHFNVQSNLGQRKSDLIS